MTRAKAQTILTTRPLADAGKDIAFFAAHDIHAIAAPMLAIHHLENALPDISAADAIAFTSRHAVFALRDEDIQRLRALPAYCVGDATAAAARDAGFGNIITGAGNAAALARTIAADTANAPRHVLWLSGKDTGFDLIAALRHSGIAASRHPVYEARKTDTIPAPALQAFESGEARCVLVHSGRTGENFTRLAAIHGIDCSGIDLIAISEPVAKSCGQGWYNIVIAPQPTRDSMLATAIAQVNPEKRK